MAHTSFSHDYSAMSSIGSLVNPCTNTVAFFDVHYVESGHSPIDAYIQNCNQLNLLWVSHSSISAELGRILLLGYVSAVESYFRSVFRLIINIDEKAKVYAHSYQVTFGAALFHDKKMLAEALLEGYSFSGEKDVKKAFNNFLEMGNVDKSILELLTEYEKICQIRHCCVHRFGKLGTYNGIALGLNEHSEVLEKPLKLDKSSLADIASWLMSFIKAVNNYLFKLILERTVDNKNIYAIRWRWDFRRDKVKFGKLYNGFAATLDSIPSPTLEVMYDRFKASMQARIRS